MAVSLLTSSPLPLRHWFTIIARKPEPYTLPESKLRSISLSFCSIVKVKKKYDFANFANFVCSSIVSVTMFWLNILEIISINYIPVLYKWYKNTATRKDCQTCLGCNVVVFALISAMLHKPHNIILMVCLILTCRRVNDALDSLFIAGRQRNIVKTAAHFFIAKMFFFYQVIALL